MSKKYTEKLSRAFWSANFVEMLERAAYYGVFIAITLYLSRILGFNDIQAGFVAGGFSAGLYLLPPFTGAWADRIGFRKALFIAFSLLTIGYFSMGILPVMLEHAGLVKYGRTVTYTGLLQSDYKWVILPIMLIIMIGGSFIKSVITGTVARETTKSNRARGYSIFYAMVNIGAFSGKTIVKPLRLSMGDEGLVTLNFFSAAMTLIAIFVVWFFYKTKNTEGEGKSMADILKGLAAVMKNLRLVVLILIITGFWMVQGQLYATMPKYVLRLAGEGASPSWYANVNPLVVVLTVGLVTRLLAKRTALFSMTIGMLIMPFSAFTMAMGNTLGTAPILGMHPVALMMVLGIVLQAIAESFISPRYFEFFSLQAPKGEEGMYLGFSQLHTFLASIMGFSLSGYLLAAYCPARREFATDAAWNAAKVHAHYIWFYFVGIAMIAAIALIIYGQVIKRLDRGID